MGVRVCMNVSSADFIKRLETVIDERTFCRYSLVGWALLFCLLQIFLKFWCVSLWVLLTLSFISMGSSFYSGNWLGTSYGLASN